MKFSTLTLLFIGFTMNIQAQEKTTLEGEIVTFPIKAKKTTDPNYEINKQKSAETQKHLDAKPNNIVKDDKYFQNQISEYNRRIQEINTNSNSESTNPDKLEALKTELTAIEKEYTDYKKSK